MMGLTPRQADCLAFIRECLEAGKVAPTYEQLGLQLSIRKSNVHRLVHALIERGYLRQLPGRRQSIALVEPHLTGDTEGLLAQLARRRQTTRDRLVEQAVSEFLERELRA